ncbi:MAG: VPLPA-CTERM sorting domain-containing protein [Pseudomonadota bacterium]
MHSLRSLLAALLVFFGTLPAHAVTFTVDTLNSSVLLTDRASGLRCYFTNCGVSADLAAGLAGTSFDIDTGNPSETFDFLTFTGAGSGGVTYDVTATLAFNPPNISTTSGGSGGALLARGSILGGALHWTDVPRVVTFADGTEIKINFQGGAGILLGHTVTTSASVSLEKVAPVPLPASAFLLLFGLGGLVGLRRFKATAV